MHTDQLGFKLVDDRQDVEEQFTHGFVGIVNGTTDDELDFAADEVIGYLVRVSEEPSQTVELRHNESISSPTRGESFAKSSAILVPACKSVINVNTARFNAESCQRLTLSSEVLFFRGIACEIDQNPSRKVRISYLSGALRQGQPEDPSCLLR